MGSVTITEIELNFCNACTGNCFICAKAHGYGNVSLMSAAVFDAVVRQLRTIQFRVIQTSGNGDCWLHPDFLEYLQTLRETFPGAIIHNYSNFALYTPQRILTVVKGCLLNKQHTRLDTLYPDVFATATGLQLQPILDNIDAFCEARPAIPFVVGYSSIPQYYRKCLTVLGKPPFHGPFDTHVAMGLPDEFEALQQRFAGYGDHVTVQRINQSLWAERADPRTAYTANGRCPKLPIFNTTVWICPDGRVNLCGYDDTQDRFTVGNILDQPLADIWLSKRRMDLIQRIATRDIKKYPCHPQCCTLYSDREV